MKIILTDLRNFIKEHFDPKLYILFFLLNAAFIIFNYTLDFEDSYIDQYRHSLLHIFLLAAYIAIGYYLTVIIQQLLLKQVGVLAKPKFWIKTTVVFLVVGFDRAFYFHKDLAYIIPPETFSFTYKCLNNLMGIISIMIPFYVVYLLLDKKQNIGYYGIKTKGIKLRPFFSLFLVIIPLVLLSAVFSEMGTYYPMYQWAHSAPFINFTGINEYLTIAIYELSYGFDFFTVELVFRGFLIIGFVKLMGKNAILPMVTAYSILHFGKPLPETISSIFGGYILGVFAYKYKHIWAGVILHIGLAWLMEIFGWIF